MTVINETLDFCIMIGSKNIFIRFFVPFILKYIDKKPTCPMSGTYRWTDNFNVNLGAEFAFTPPFLKSMKGSLVTGVAAISSDVNGKRVRLIERIELARVTQG
jgi:hypothetical protein